MILRRLAVLPLLALAACVSQRPRVTIADYGIYGTAATTGEAAAPRTGLGSVHVIDSLAIVPLLRKTTSIPAAAGTRFGVRFILTGDKYGAVVPLRVRVTHPLIKERTMDEWDIEGQNGILRYTGWRFDDASELVPGQWRFQILEADVVVAEKKFDVRVE